MGLDAPFYRYSEPHPGGSLVVTVSRQYAIDTAKMMAKTQDHPYPNDERALEDFVIIHWAEPTQYENPLAEIEAYKEGVIK